MLEMLTHLEIKQQLIKMMQAFLLQIQGFSQKGLPHS